MKRRSFRLYTILLIVLSLWVAPAVGQSSAPMHFEEIFAQIKAVKLTATARTYEVTLDRGREDGFLPGWRGKAYSLARTQNGVKTDFEPIGTAEILSVEARTATARVVLNANKSALQTTDIVEIKARVPQREPNALLWRLAALHIGVADLAKRQNFADYRVRFAQPNLQAELALYEAMLKDIQACVEFVENGELDKEPYKKGRYAGRKISAILRNVTRQDLADFFTFVVCYPGKYIGYDWKLSEIFATWVLNDAPTSYEEIANAWFAAKTPAERAALLERHRALILKESLIENWHKQAQALSNRRLFAQAHAYADLALQAANRFQQPKHRAWARFAQGYIYSDQANRPASQAAYQQALAEFQSLKPQDEEARRGYSYTLNNLAVVYHAMGRLNEAAATYEKSLKFKESLPNVEESSAAITWQGLGETRFAQANYALARKCFQRAADLRKKSAEFPGMRSSLLWLATTQARLGETDAATNSYEAVLATQRREEDRSGIAETLIKLGDHLWRNGRYPAALNAYQEAAQRYADLDDRKQQIEAQHGIGKLYWNLGDYAQSQAAQETALRLCTESGDKTGQARAHKEIADVLQKSGDLPGAKRRYALAKALYREQGAPLGEADALSELALIQIAQKEMEAALQTLAEARALYRKGGSKQGRARTEFNRGVCFENRYDFPAAKQSYESALALQQEIGDKAEQTDALLAIGSLLWRKNELEAAVAQLNQALALAKQIKSQSQEAKALLRLGGLQARRFQFAPAREAIDRVFVISRDPQVKDRNLEADALFALGDLLENQGRYGQALRAYRDSRTLGETLRNRALQQRAWNRIGWLHRTLGQPTDALNAQQTSLRIAQDLNDEVSIADIYYALSALHSDFGDARKALECVQQAQQRYSGLKNEVGLAQADNALGVFYFRQGDHDESARYLERSLKRAEKCLAQRDILITLTNLGEIHFRRENFAAALPLLKRALTLAQTLGDREYFGSISVTMGRCQREQGEFLRRRKDARGAQRAFEQADAALTQALKLLRTYDAQGSIASATLELGRLRAAQQRFAAAEGLCRAAVEIGEKMQEKHLLWEAYWAQGQVFEAQKRLSEATASLRKSIAILEALKQGVAGGDTGVAKFVHSKVQVYEYMAELLGRLAAQTKDAETKRQLAQESLRYVSMARHEILNTSVTNTRKTGDDRLDQAAQAYREATLRQGRLEREKTEATNSGNRVKAEAIEAILAKNDEELAANYVKLAEADADFASRLKFDPRRLTESVAALPEKTTLFVCFPGHDALHLWLFDKNGLKVWNRVPLSRKDLYGLVQQFRNGVDQMKERVSRREKLGVGFGAAAEANERNPSWYRENVKGMRESLERLYSALISPVESELAASETLLILPYGQLCYLPYEALLKPNSDPAQGFLGRRKRIAYFTSEPHLQGVLRDLERPQPAAPDCWVAFADPRGQLGSALEEAQEIAGLFPTSEIHSQKTGTATKPTIYTLRPDCTILHFATHGWLNSANPNQTFLELGIPQGGPQTVEVKLDNATMKLESDGALTQMEIYPRLRKLVPSFKKRQLRLVTLSACETARGQESPEAEVLGMPDAFTLAGAGAVLASQWSVETYSTTDLMIAFYRLYAREKRPKADALMQAKQSLLQQSEGRYAHPFYWAAFVLYGDWR